MRRQLSSLLDDTLVIDENSPIRTFGKTAGVFMPAKEYRVIRALDKYRIKGRDRADLQLKQLHHSRLFEEFRQLTTSSMQSNALWSSGYYRKIRDQAGLSKIKEEARAYLIEHSEKEGDRVMRKKARELAQFLQEDPFVNMHIRAFNIKVKQSLPSLNSFQEGNSNYQVKRSSINLHDDSIDNQHAAKRQVKLRKKIIREEPHLEPTFDSQAKFQKNTLKNRKFSYSPHYVVSRQKIEESKQEISELLGRTATLLKKADSVVNAKAKRIKDEEKELMKRKLYVKIYNKQKVTEEMWWEHKLKDNPGMRKLLGK